MSSCGDAPGLGWVVAGMCERRRGDVRGACPFATGDRRGVLHGRAGQPAECLGRGLAELRDVRDRWFRPG